MTLGTVTMALSVSISSADEPTLADTSERLSAGEEKHVRSAVYNNSPVTGGLGADRPFARTFELPKAVQTAYESKPRAAVRLLLKIVEGGRPGDSIHAVACIQALVKNPEYAAIGVRGADEKTWDEVIGGRNPGTRRELAREVCVKLIVEKESPKEGKGRK
jgi:hypothetical protein